MRETGSGSGEAEKLAAAGEKIIWRISQKARILGPIQNIIDIGLHRGCFPETFPKFLERLFLHFTSGRLLLNLRMAAAK